MKLNGQLRLALPAVASLLLAACASTGSGTGAAPISTTLQSLPATAGLAELVDAAKIPFERFTLENGLTTIVHTDRKAPIVGVTVYYRVGSKHEPRGRTGFAHLFEHLMFGGSENVENFDIPLEGAGSTSTNGSTSFDRTNYVETVPTGALDLALFMESDRMGYLLGAVTQEKLDNQRAVVQNEKRQSDNQPGGLIDYILFDGLLPVGHPYRHATIGSMADLDAASLEDVSQWFTANYGPNNVILVLAGDIDAATARPKVERWFGAIPRGPEIAALPAAPVTLPAAVDRVVTDQVPLTSIYRSWIGPGLNDPDAVPLEVGMYILGGLKSSRLENALVRGEELAVSATALAWPLEDISLLQASVDVKKEVERERALAAMETQIAGMLSDGPTADELERAKTQLVASAVSSLESVGGFGGKGMILAEGLLYSGDPAFYRAQLNRLVRLSPADVQQAMQRWLSRPPYTISLIPGERTLDGAVMGGWGDEEINPAPAPDDRTSEALASSGELREAPPVSPVGELTFPQVERATLSNGIEVQLARRTAVPQLSLAMTFDAGSVVDPIGSAGVHKAMVALLSEGTTTRSALDIAIAQEQLGSALSVRAGPEADTVALTTLTINLAPSIELMADVVRNPAFRADDVARVRAQRLAQIADELTSPGGLANRAFMPLVYGTDHPYARASSAGDAEAVASVTRDALIADHRDWIRPDLATIIAVGDVSMPQLVATLEASFGGWMAPSTPAPDRSLDRPAPAPTPRLVVIDRPNAPSSYLLIGRATPLVGEPDNIVTVETANEVLGAGFLSRLMGDLREKKGWTYGIGSAIPVATGQRQFRIATQVQADRTADSIRVILDQMSAFPATRPADEIELQRVTDGNIRGLPNRYETNAQVLGALVSNQAAGRDPRYQAQLPDLYRSIDAAAIDAAARAYLRPDDLTIVVVGDRKVIDAQLEALAMPITYLVAEDL